MFPFSSLYIAEAIPVTVEKISPVLVTEMIPFCVWLSKLIVSVEYSALLPLKSNSKVLDSLLRTYPLGALVSVSVYLKPTYIIASLLEALPSGSVTILVMMSPFE